MPQIGQSVTTYGPPPEWVRDLLPPREQQRASWFRRLFCRHSSLTLTAKGSAVIAEDAALLPVVEVTCSRCGEFWHAELDASEAMRLYVESLSA